MHLLVLLVIQNDASDSGALCGVRNDDVKSFVEIKLQAATNIEEQSRKSPKPTGESIAEEHVIAKSSNAINREKCLVEKRDVLGRISPDPAARFLTRRKSDKYVNSSRATFELRRKKPRQKIVYPRHIIAS